MAISCAAAMRAGAYDYLVKPFSVEEVGLTLDRVLEVSSLRQENRALKIALDRPVLVTPEQARTVMECYIAADLSAERGEPVALPLPEARRS